MTSRTCLGHMIKHLGWFAVEDLVISVKKIAGICRKKTLELRNSDVSLKERRSIDKPDAIVFFVAATVASKLVLYAFDVARNKLNLNQTICRSIKSF